MINVFPLMQYEGSAVTHTLNDDKTDVTVSWTAPDASVGDVYIK